MIATLSAAVLSLRAPHDKPNIVLLFGARYYYL